MSKFKLFVVAALSWFLISSSGASITFDAAERQTFYSAVVTSAVLTSAVDDMPIEAVSHSDAVAKRNARAARSAVFIREDVEIKDIRGNEREVKGASTGSGTVIAVRWDGKSSLILTAHHVCTNSYDVGDVVVYDRFVITSTVKKLVTFDGDEMDVRVLHEDRDNDLCVMEADGKAGLVAPLTSYYPPLGASVYTAGAPSGQWGKGTANIVMGIFSGVVEEDISYSGYVGKKFLQCSIPTIGGMSGSSIYYRGKVIGVLVAGHTSYEHLMYGPGPGVTKKAVEAAMEIWNK